MHSNIILSTKTNYVLIAGITILVVSTFLIESILGFFWQLRAVVGVLFIKSIL
jgi:hypothetical protein